MRAAHLIIADIESFSPVDEDWQPLHELIAELLLAGPLPVHLPALFGVFERYPTDDSFGVFWGVMHAIEALPFDYESELLASVRRTPGDFNTLMVNRIANSGQPCIGGQRIGDIFREILQRPDVLPPIREQVEGFISFQETPERTDL